ncbi:MAG TPA: DNA polymerase/3'-5' exonuclease PolX [Candidatus Omnitrophota bacterium]|nr:DNA polymerase/3'-5' exonuclease PolX [Candidatus Omnitrophota bacterium]
MENADLAKIFYETAELSELKGDNVFKVRAYENAARNLEALSKNVEDIYRSGGVKALTEIPGIGQSIAEHIEEIVKKGTFKKYRDLKAEFPKDFIKMIEVPGIGPKTAMTLLKELKIDSIGKLEKAIKAGALEKLRGMGKKKEANILKGIELKKRSVGRFLLPDAIARANAIVDHLNKLKEVEKLVPAGSLRRWQETIGDIDILVISGSPEKVMAAFTSFSEVDRVLAKGPTKSSVLLKNGMQADVRVVEPRCFGAALAYFTGNKQHNILMRERAIKMGYKLSEYGLFKKEKFVCGRTEEELFRCLKLDYIPPELRQGTDEIELAEKGRLPRLIELSDIKGDLQMHSTWSDGNNRIEEMAAYGKKLGYDYIAITDHSQAVRVAGGMDEKQAAKQLKEIDRINGKLKGIMVLKGIEVDILGDGKLDLPDSILREMDVVVAAVHSRFKMPKKEMTDRIIAAFNNKYVNLLSHPTGRVIGKRDPYEVDMERIIKEAKATGTFLEINAYPERLDLNDIHTRMAKEAKVMLSIDTDSHLDRQLENMVYGVETARRGGIEAKDAINTRPLPQLLKLLKQKR